VPQKTLYLCQDCNTEWEVNISSIPSNCNVCGSGKVYKSHHHKRAAKKMRSKERWSYKVK
jgi:DNA-directed RNA polymerase subunit RPC12/RpoP